MWKDFFYFTAKEKRGILVLTLIIAGIITAKYLFPNSKNQKIIVVQKFSEEVKVPKERNNSSGEKAYFNDPQKPQNEIRTYYNNDRKNFDSIRNNHPKTEKYTLGTRIKINSADTLELMKIPGIGRSFALKIAKYRQLLGGYYSVEQLKEVYGMYEELYVKIVPYFEVNTDSLQLIPVNQCSLERLKAHPYIDFYQAKAMIELRKKKGKLLEIDELNMFEEFQQGDIEKIRHYLSFE